MRPSLILILACLAALGLLRSGPAAAEPVLTLTVAPDGVIRASGEVPDAFPLAKLRRRMPEIDASGARHSHGKGDADNWNRALDALTVILPRLHAGKARIALKRLAVRGTLRPGFSAEATRGAVRLALGSGWKTELDLAEPPPRAAFTLAWSPRGAVASGILPRGLAPDEALDLLGGPSHRGLTGGGDGDPAAWRRALRVLARLRPAYRHATARLAPGRLSVEGMLQPGHGAARLKRWLVQALGDGWEVGLAGIERPAPAGTIRVDPVEGGPQRLIRGHWLPIHNFAPRLAACARRAGAILAEEPVRFVIGRADLAEGSAPVLDRLAGLARRCLNEGGLSVEIGGHTDSRGTENENRMLSERRAMSVLLELVMRGVRADAMTARGYGELHPVADNDTVEGRARNRRITFDWTE